MRSPSLTTMTRTRSKCGVGENLADAVPVGIAEEEAARLAPDLAEALAALADGRRVDERQQFLDVRTSSA